jgi:23S rRNA (guanine745-N1)-methyltransferase
MACPAGHRFDLARSGYCNLLQPQDSRSRHPGDSAAAVAARRRLFDAGHGDWLVPHLLQAVTAMEAMGLSLPRSVLDVGCGEGFYLAATSSAATAAANATGASMRRGDTPGSASPGDLPAQVEAHGLDLAAAAVDLAARRYPAATLVVANADRFLPYADGSFDLAMVLTAHLNPPELRRVLAPGGARDAARRSGWLLVAVPGADDLIELRQAVLGEGHLRPRLAATIATLDASFELVHQATATTRLRLPPPALQDLLAATYRGGRNRERQRAAALAETEITVSRDLACFRPRPH